MIKNTLSIILRLLLAIVGSLLISFCLGMFVFVILFIITYFNFNIFVVIIGILFFITTACTVVFTYMKIVFRVLDLNRLESKFFRISKKYSDFT